MQPLAAGTDMFAFVNGRVMTERGLIAGLAVLVEGSHIAGIVAAGDTRLVDLHRCDLQGRMLLPGFIDSQCNGGGGVLFNNAPTVESLKTIAAAHRRFGTTGFMATLITDDAETTRVAVDAVAQAIAQNVPGLLGVHLEGPFLNAKRKGIHDSKKFRQPDEGDLQLLTRGDAGVMMVTLAPERVTPDVIRYLAGCGVVVSAGHTAADYETTRAALNAGMRGFTHLFNAMTPLTSREPGAVGAALDDPDSWCGVIVDGHHVHPASLRVAIAAKAPGKVMLVTDAMPPVGADRPDFVLDGQTITDVNGVCMNASGTLAGSALDMATAVRNTVRMLGVPLAEASRMASAYPAAFLGLSGQRGAIVSGQRADFAVVDDDIRVHETWIGGIRYDAAGVGSVPQAV